MMFLGVPLKLRRAVVLHSCFVKRYLIQMASTFRGTALESNTQWERLCWEGSSHQILLRKFESALNHRQLDEAWVSFHHFKNLYGFPKDFLVNRLIVELSYSSDPIWLQKACDLVLQILKKKSDLLQHHTLTKLSLSLARSQMPIPASAILRLMLEMKSLPPMNVLLLVVFHIIKTEIGTCLASNFLVQVCDSFKHLSGNKCDCAMRVKPDAMIFNIVLSACVTFKLPIKGQQITELMAQTGTVADAHSIVIISQIQEMNGLRDEMKKLKGHIDRVSAPCVRHYSVFYDSLLSLHFKFNDIDAVSELVLGMNRYREPFTIQKGRKDAQMPCLVPIGSHNLKSGLKIQIAPELLQRDSVLKMGGRQELIIFRDGKLVLSSRALAKVIIGYKRGGRISELSKLLLSIQKDLCLLEGSSLCSDVIDACIQLGWLETAHDILDDMEASGAAMGWSTYVRLLAAYHRGNMFREAKALMKQMKKVGLGISLSDDTIISMCLSEMVNKAAPAKTSVLLCKSDPTVSLVQELRNEEAVDTMIYEFNSSIYFFCKAKMVGDALKTYRRMQEMEIQPTVQTFANLVSGYSSLGMYRDITILWADIKRFIKSGNLLASTDLYELLLLCFLQAGYFERVMEVISHMREHNMYIDKCMYKSEFLRLHKNLYRSLKASNARTDAQSKRLENVQAFRKFVGID
ncbi:Pentatricopeptide repeat [Quillaja saponaria]|uniref:Pentatricopeptide repeat n=1 Tax=Quillaja saponaria TaxID=32244 RepID=A0AAD7PK76_QUISA|nr:Pentatricopeptide repeat [Quillaja saponaria]